MKHSHNKRKSYRRGVFVLFAQVIRVQDVVLKSVSESKCATLPAIHDMSIFFPALVSVSISRTRLLIAFRYPEMTAQTLRIRSSSLFAAVFLILQLASATGRRRLSLEWRVDAKVFLNYVEEQFKVNFSNVRSMHSPSLRRGFRHSLTRAVRQNLVNSSTCAREIRSIEGLILTRDASRV
jgi:hypothetical protein